MKEDDLTDVRIGLWDTEFTPNTGHFWGLWDQNIPYPFVNDTQRMLCFGFKFLGKPTKVVDERVGRLEMLTQLRDYLDEVDFLVSWNGTGYDTKMANREFLKEGLTPPSPYREIDLMRVVKQRFKFSSNKLGSIADELGVGKKIETGGFDLWRGVMAGDEKAWRKMRRYQKQDVDLLEELYHKLIAWIRMPHPVTDKADACRNCGSQKIQRRGLARTLNGSYARVHCQVCGAWGRLNERTPVGTVKAI